MRPAAPRSGARDAIEPGRERVRDVARVAAERLVAAVAVQRHRHVPPGHLQRGRSSGSPTSPRRARRSVARAAAARRSRRCGRRTRGARSRSARRPRARAAARRNASCSKPIEKVCTGRAELCAIAATTADESIAAREERTERDVARPGAAGRARGARRAPARSSSPRSRPRACAREVELPVAAIEACPSRPEQQCAGGSFRAADEAGQRRGDVAVR